MLRIPLGAVAALLTCSVCFARPAERPAIYDAAIARGAKIHCIPETLVHRVVLRESRYNPRLVHNHCFGLMQIKYATARSMGYTGTPNGLLDPQVNLTYGIPYLANAYHIAGGDEDRATALYRGGYYYAAKRKKMLGELRTAASPAPTQVPAPVPVPEPPRNPFAQLFSALGAPANASQASSQ